MTRINPHNNEIVEVIALGPRPGRLAVGEGGVWTLNRGNGTVTRVDPEVTANGGVSLWNRHFHKAARHSRLYRRNNPFNVRPQHRPLGIPEHKNGDSPASQILLIPDVLVGGDQDLEPGGFGRDEQFAVAERVPSFSLRLTNGVALKKVLEWGWCAVIEENAH